MLLSHRMLLLVWLLSMFQVIIWNIKDFIKVCSFFDVLFFKCRAGFRIYIILLLPEELLMMNSVSFDSSSVRSLLGYNWQIVRYIKCTRLGFYVLIQYERTPPIELIGTCITSHTYSLLLLGSGQHWSSALLANFTYSAQCYPTLVTIADILSLNPVYFTTLSFHTFSKISLFSNSPAPGTPYSSLISMTLAA